MTSDTSIYITQLVFLNPGHEATFEEFEAVAIPLIAKHGGELLLRLRPDAASVIAGGNVPYEVHLVRFESDADFDRFARDPERQQFLHLKEQSVRSTLLVKGTRL